MADDKAANAQKSKGVHGARLDDYRVKGRLRQPPIAQLSPELVKWQKDLLPELLWLDLLLESSSLSKSANLAHSTLDTIDAFVDDQGAQVLTGLVSSFSLVADHQRIAAVKALKDTDLYETAFPHEFRSALLNYPSCPMYWLVASESEEDHDLTEGLEFVAGSVLRLFDSHGKHASRCRMIPLARMFKHGKIMLSPDVADDVAVLAEYSEAMDPDRQSMVESMVRAMFLSISNMLIDPQHWSAPFWRRNDKISQCVIAGYGESSDDRVIGALPIIGTGYRRIKRLSRRWNHRKAIRATTKSLVDAMQALRHDFARASSALAIDLYDIDRSDVLLGLVSRQFHFFGLIAHQPRLWTPQFGLIVHRVMADNQIVLRWLMRRNDSELFIKFKEYSLGHLTLFRLHLERVRLSTRMDTIELESMLSERVGAEINEQLLSIDVGAPFEVSIRQMAIEVDLKDLYDLVYAPSSAEVHGEWSSLKEYNLEHCLNPLHRFHWLPDLEQVIHLSPGIPLTASSLLVDLYQDWLEGNGIDKQHSTSVRRFRRMVRVTLVQEGVTRDLE